MLSLFLLLLGLQSWIQHAKCHEQIPIQAAADFREKAIYSGRHETNFTNDKWTFNFSSSAPHIFSSLHGLLQQWPNTFFPNGHSIVPCQIPAFTSLYHGRQDGELPESPEWVAFDIEMSYGIMGSGRNSHILTYQTTKPTGCLYFDGESATLMGTGQMDTQMLFIYGNVTGPPAPDDGRRFRGLQDEYDRASGLCQWVQDKKLGGPGWGVEGIVRMNAGFEMIWCNFTSPSLRLLTKLNVTAPLLRPNNDDDDDDGEKDVSDFVNFEKTYEELTPTSPTYYPLPTETSPPDRSTDPDQPPMPPGWRRDDQEPFLASQTWGWFESATWHYGSSGIGAGRGESRVKPLTCGFLTFYDPVFSHQQDARFSAEQKKLNITVDGLWQGPGKDEYRKFALNQLMRRRRYHLLRNISEDDASGMNTAAERVLKDFNFDDRTGFHHFSNSIANCSGMDWIAVSNDIVQRYAPRLQQLNSILGAASSVDMTNSTAIRKWFSGLRQHTHFLLMPYFEYASSATAPNGMPSPATRQLTLSRCKYQYTRLIAPDSYAPTLSLEELLLVSTVEETLENICTWVIDAGFAIDQEWFDHFDGQQNLQFSKADTPTASTFIQRINWWKAGLEELMAWLGWVDQWTYCKSGCGWDEVCFIPMWPMDSIDQPRRRFGPGPGSGPGPGYGYGPGRGGRGGRGRDMSPGRSTDVEHLNEEQEEHPEELRAPPGRPSGPPSWFTNEDSLWEPKCIKAEYIV